MTRKIYKFRLPERCSISEVWMRETDGFDEERAEIAAGAKGAEVFGEELIRWSIMGWNGESHDPGSAPISGWSTRTRRVLNRYWDRLNLMTRDDVQHLINDAVYDDHGAVFQFPPGSSVSSVRLRETSGRDEIKAGRAADKSRSNIGLELVSGSIVEIDDVPVSGTPSMKPWTTKTRTAIQHYWSSLNDATEDELGPLLAEGMEDLESHPLLVAAGAEM